MKSFWLIVLALLVLVGGYFAFLPDPPREEGDIAALEKPWVEVVESSVFIKFSDGRKTELRSGDTIEAGSSLVSEGAGRADIHFPNGSVSRLDRNSEVTLNEAMFSPQKFSVRLMLRSGKVWSKVFSEKGSGSLWEVETNTAVATVRGTSFSVEVDGGKTVVLGSEHTVRVAPKDPETGKALEQKAIDVAGKTFVEIDRSVLDALISGKGSLEPKPVPESLLKSEWVRENEQKDESASKEYEEMKEPRDEEGPSRILQKRPEDAQKIILDEKKDMPARNEEKTELLKKDVGTLPIRPSPVLPKPSSAVPSAPSPVSLKITAEKGNIPAVLQEKETTPLRALVKFSDGSERDMTANASWRVVGDVGAIESPGVFRATLAPSISEQGKGFGAVMATVKNSKGELISGQTVLFTVEAAKEAAPPKDIGGQ